MSCLTKFRKAIKDADIKMPESRILDYARRLDELKAESLSKAQFAEAAKLMIDNDVMLTMLKYQAAEKINLLKFNEAKAAVRAKLMGKSTFDNLRNFEEGGQLDKGVGGNYAVKTIRESIYAIVKAMFNKSVENHIDALEGGVLDKEVIQELFHQSEGRGEGKSGSKAAAEVAKGWIGVQNKMFDLMSSMNPFLEKTKEYIMKHMYDGEKFMKPGEQEAFVEFALANSKRSMPDLTDPAKRQEVFQNISERIKDRTYGTVQDDATAGEFTDYSKPERDIMKSSARHRVIIWDTPEAYYEANKRWGYGNMAETMEAMMRKFSRNFSVLEKWGANPEKTQAALISDSLRNAKGADLKDLQTRKLQLEKSFRQSVGLNDAPAQTTGAQITQGVLTTNFLIRAGAATLHSLTDLGSAAALIHGVNGKNLFSNGLEFVQNVANMFTHPEARREIMENMALIASTANHVEMSKLGSPENSPGLLGKTVNMFSRITGIKSWHESMKAAAAIMLSKYLGKLSDMSWDELPEGPRSEMQRYKIDEHEWEYLKKAAQPWDGPLDSRMTSFKDLKVSNLHLVPEEHLETMMRAKGIEGAGADIEGSEHTNDNGEETVEKEYTEKQKFLAKSQAMLHLGAMINDFAAYSAAEPGDRQNAFLRQGHDINDPMGMALRLVTQFKGPMITMMDSYRRGHANGETPRGAWSNVAQHAILNMFFFTISDMALQLATGKQPEDPRSLRYAMKVVAGSGGGGIFAEILADEMGKRDKMSMAYGALKTLAGPTISNALEGSASVTQGFKAGAKHGLKAGLKEPVNWAISNLPGQNMPLLGTRGALGYYFTNGLKEFLGPGHLNAMMNGPDGTREKYFMMNPRESKRWLR